MTGIILIIALFALCTIIAEVQVDMLTKRHNAFLKAMNPQPLRETPTREVVAMTTRKREVRHLIAELDRKFTVHK